MSSEHIIVPVRTYVAVFVALLVLGAVPALLLRFRERVEARDAELLADRLGALDVLAEGAAVQLRDAGVLTRCSSGASIPPAFR